ncbi:MAG: DNA-3-methyladenine glycosylase I [Phycisphaerales bacterium]
MGRTGRGRAATRCGWARSEPELSYHDAEWGVPERDESRLFELITLEGAQSGLSWRTILLKRENYRRAFRNFEVERVARMGARDVERLLGVTDPARAIVRHRGKIESTIENARAIMKMRSRGETLGELAWSLVGGEPIQNRWRTMGELPGETDVSRRMSRELKRRGLRFVGPTTCYAFMQAAGLVNDHLVGCFRHSEVGGGKRR